MGNSFFARDIILHRGDFSPVSCYNRSDLRRSHSSFHHEPAREVRTNSNGSCTGSSIVVDLTNS